MIVYETGKANSDSGKLDKTVMLSAQLSNLFTYLDQKCSRIRTRFKTNAPDNAIVEITQSNNGLISTNIDSK